MKIHLPILKEGDKIGIIAPAGGVLLNDIEENVCWIKQNNWVPIFGKNIFNEYYFGYNYAGTEAERTHDFQWALDDNEIKAIWCARGGYGGIHIIDNLDFTLFKKNPKWFIGYSDNTVFHQYFNLHHFPTIHGIVMKDLVQKHSKNSFESIKTILKGKPISYKIKSHKYNNIGEINGILTGGNLSIIYSLMGSKTLDNFQNKILFIEDWRENWYHLDRMLMCLERANIFKKIKGIIIGGFTQMDDKLQHNFESTFDEESFEIIQYRLEKYTYPKIFGFPAGHVFDNRALILGKEASLVVNKENAILTF